MGHRRAPHRLGTDPTDALHRPTANAVPRNPPEPKFDHRNTEFRGQAQQTQHSYGMLPMERIKNLTIHFPEDITGRDASVVRSAR